MRPSGGAGDRDRFDLDQEIRVREPAYFDRGAGRKRSAEIFHAHLDVTEKFVDVGGEGLGAHEIGEVCSGRGERGLEVLAYLANLPAHVTLADDLAVPVARQQARNEDEPARDDGDHGRIEHAPADDTL